MTVLLPSALLEDLFGACGPDERQCALLEGIEAALRGSDVVDERIPRAALAAARVAALTAEEDELSPGQQQQQLLLEPLALGVRLEAGAVARLLEVCRRRRRRSRRRRRRREGEEDEDSLLLLLEAAAAAASQQLAPSLPPSAEEEEAEEEEEASEGPSSSSPSLVRWSAENGASVSFEAKSWRRRRRRRRGRAAPATTAERKDSTSRSFFILQGAAATENISPGQQIARIPLQNLIHSRMLNSTDAGRAICSLKLPDEEEALLAFTLLDAADEDSPRAPIWDSLLHRSSSQGTSSSSSSLLRTALNATREEISLLDERTPARRVAERAAEHATAAARSAEPLLSSLRRAFGSRVRAELAPGVGSFSEEAYRWAMAVWYAYAIELEIEEEEGEEEERGEEEQGGNGSGSSRRKRKTLPCLAPPLFLLNHSPHPHCVSYMLEEEETEDEGGKGGEEKKNKEAKKRFLVARVCRSAEKGEQLFLSYGRLLSKSAAHSLCYYGFVVPSGEDPDAALEIELLDALEGREKGEGGEGGAAAAATTTASSLLLPSGLETRHFIRATGALSPALLSAAEEVASAAAASASASASAAATHAPPLAAGEVVRRAVSAAQAALAATAERAEGAIGEDSSSSFSSSSSAFAHAVLDYARSGVELADRVAAAAGALRGL